MKCSKKIDLRLQQRLDIRVNVASRASANRCFLNGMLDSLKYQCLLPETQEKRVSSRYDDSEVLTGASSRANHTSRDHRSRARARKADIEAQD